MDLSVMICTWNNSQQLAITLAAISQCDIPDDIEWELVLVNNNSTDDTDSIALQFATQLPLVYIHEPQQGLSRARNTGLSAASGRLIIFTDDDVRPYRQWIAAYWNTYLQKPSGFYFGGPIDSEYEKSGPDAEILSVAPPSVKGLDHGQQARLLTRGEYFIGPNWASPVEGLKAVGGFDTQKGLDPSIGKIRVGEELDLMNRLQRYGWSPWYVPDARLRHFVPFDKCGIEHIAARLEAGVFEWTLNEASRYLDGQRLIIGNVPLFLYNKALSRWWKWVVAKMLGKKGHHEYLMWQISRGAIRGLRTLGRVSNRESPTSKKEVVLRN